MVRPSSTADLALLLSVIAAVMAAGSAMFGVTTIIIAVGVPVAAASALYAIRRPAVALIAMIVIEVTNLAGVLAQRVQLPVFGLSLLLGVVTVLVALRDPLMRRRLNRTTVVCVGLFGCYLVTQALAALGSQNLQASITTFTTGVMDYVFLVVLLVLAQLSEKPWAIAAAVVVPLAAISVLCLISQIGFAGAASFGGFATVTDASGEMITTLRFGGPGLDSNFWGRNLILGLPLAAALIARAVQAGRQPVVIGWAAAMLALLAGVYLTQSRGTLIAAAVVFLVWVVASGPVARRRGLKSSPLVALVLFVPGIGNRFVALLADVSGSTPNNVIDPSVLGRAAAQETAWKMFWDRPLFGFGPGTFESARWSYAGMVPTAVLQPADAPHNLYAQLAAESGIVGLVGWAIFIGGFIALAVRAIRHSAISAPSERVMPAAVLAALVGWSAASIFLHLANFRTFAIILALAGALASTADPGADRRVQYAPHRFREVVLSGILGSGVSALVLIPTTGVSYVASHTVTLLPSQQSESFESYALDLRSRDVMLPTYAAMMAAGSPGVTSVADTVRGVITISIATTEKGSAGPMLERALQRADANLAEFGADSLYTVEPTGDIEVRTTIRRHAVWTPVAGLAAVLTAVGTALMMRRLSGGRFVNGRNASSSERRGAALIGD